jgi:hypothetical protein
MTTEPPLKFDPANKRRPRHLADAKTEEITFPLVWLVIGGLAALIVIGLIGLGVVNIFRQQAITPTPETLPPLVEPIQAPAIEEAPAPTVEAPVVEEPAQNPPAAEENPPSEQTPPEAQPAPPGDIIVDSYVIVTGTGGNGVNVRAGPGRNNARMVVADENPDVRLFVLDGPRDDENGEDYTWWFVRHPDGSEGWVVEDFIVPAQ